MTQLLERIKNTASKKEERNQLATEIREAKHRKDELEQELYNGKQIDQVTAIQLVAALGNRTAQGQTQGGLLGTFKIVSTSTWHTDSEESQAAMQGYSNALQNFNNAMEALCNSKIAVIKQAATSGELLHRIELNDMNALKKLDFTAWFNLQHPESANTEQDEY